MCHRGLSLPRSPVQPPIRRSSARFVDRSTVDLLPVLSCLFTSSFVSAPFGRRPWTGTLDVDFGRRIWTTREIARHSIASVLISPADRRTIYRGPLPSISYAPAPGTIRLRPSSRGFRAAPRPYRPSTAPFSAMRHEEAQGGTRRHEDALSSLGKLVESVTYPLSTRCTFFNVAHVGLRLVVNITFIGDFRCLSIVVSSAEGIVKSNFPSPFYTQAHVI
jgi:hypothetical protein